MEHMTDTNWSFALVLRQKYQEEIFRQALATHHVHLESPKTLTAIHIDDSLPKGDYRVLATIRNALDNTEEHVRCRYLIGCDGGKSTVRRLMNIPFNGSTSEDRWVRIDGVVKTNLPKPRTYCAIESPTHGNVLWAALDHGATRIGYAFTADRAKAYDVFDEAAAAKEAVAACLPFDVSFERVDWWTIYSVGQRVAERFFVHDSVFLAGDACHTHSSGAAQGMNTGIHDSVNLAWKLALVLKGLAKVEVLDSYGSEREPNVQRLIRYDRDIARLMSMQLPEGWQGDPGADPNVVLGEVMKEAGTFSSGLAIFYELEEGNKLSVMGSFRCEEGLEAVRPGKRAPDVTLLKPGTLESTRLIQQTPNVAGFYVAIFAGDPAVTQDCLKGFSQAVRKSLLQSTRKSLECPLREHLLIQIPALISWLTIPAATGASPYELLGDMDPLGRVYYDGDKSAHKRYAIDTCRPAAVVLRPDGWIGTMIDLTTENPMAQIERYFKQFLKI